jgi:hypothetical protein
MRVFNFLSSVCFLAAAILQANCQTPRMATFSAANHPKAGGINFSLSYPSNWTAREGKRPHIVQMFVSPDPSEFFNVSVYDLENSDQSTYDAIVSKEGIKSLLPEGTEMISHSVTKLDGEVCGMVECVSNSERAGIKMEMRYIYFAVPIQGRVIILTGSIGGLVGSPDLAVKYAGAKPRLLSIAASLVLMDKWTNKATTVATINQPGFVDVASGGLSLKLPKELSALSEETTSGGEIESLKKFTCVSGTRSVIVKHFVFRKPLQIGPEAAADMLESDLRKEIGFSSTRKETNVDGAPGILLRTSWQKLGATASQTILLFSRDNELWEVHLFGVNDDLAKELEEMKSKVFQSIKFMR